MRKLILSSLFIGLFAAATTQAADKPPIPVVDKNCKALQGAPRPASDTTCQDRLNKFNDQAKTGGFDVLFIGDSITHLWEQHGKEVWEKRIAPFKAANFGIGGDTTGNVIWRLDNGNLQGALEPKLVVLMLGTNNAGQSTPEETAAGLGAILERLHKRFPKARLLLFPIFARSQPGTLLRKINDDVNKIISQYDGYWNIKWVDINPKLTDAAGNRLPGCYWDETHLTAAGFEVWADALVPEIEAVLKK